MDTFIGGLPPQIGSYEIRYLFSDSGRNRLFYAYDQHFGKYVIIKLLPIDFFSDPDFRKHLEQDVRLLSAKPLPAIVPVYDIGEYESRSYLVEQYMPAGSLAERIAEGPLELTEVVRITEKLSQGLDAAHERGVLHLNIKPSNVLFDENDEPFLSDFGQVRISQASPTDVLNEIDGAPAYSSPEQALGQFDLDHRSDLYAFGALVFTMLSGRVPYPDENPVIQAMQHVSSPTPDILKLRPDLPVGCAAAIDWALCKDPDLRYASAGEFAAIFAQQALRTQPVKKPRSARPLRIALLFLLVLLLTGAAAGQAMGIFDLNKAPQNISGAINQIAFMVNPPTATPVPPTHTPTLSPPTLTPTLPPPTTAPTYTPIPTRTRVPTQAPTPTPTRLVIGFADKIAVIRHNDIWVANLDGSDLERVTTDQKTKSDLRWTPDGKALVFSNGLCYQMLTYPEKVVTQLGCFEDLAISPDMSSMVIGRTVILDNGNKQWLNFYGPFDLLLQGLIRDIPRQPVSGGFPFQGGRLTQFSADGQTLASVFRSPYQGTFLDVLELFSLRGAGENVDVHDYIPGNRFSLRGYLGPNDAHTLSDFGWDGDRTFAVHGIVSRTGYGDMVIYTRLPEQNNFKYEKIAPIDGQCCYQDIQWSPNSEYLLFVFQDNRYLKDTLVYYEPYATIREDLPRTPLPFPEGFFDDPTPQPGSARLEPARVEPALRPAKP
jgi:serine/threonine protein kinase